MCFNNSFASSDKAIFWSKENKLSPRQVFKNCNSKFFLKCCECNHEFESSLGCVSRINGSWCPFCSHTKLCDERECNMCLKNSFASSDKAIFWSKFNKLIPRQVFISSTKKFFFECVKSHKFEIVLSDVTKGTWCRLCLNKTEGILFNILKKIFKEDDIVKEFKMNDCKKKNLLPFDFFINFLRIIIELDGRQHFKQVMNWKCPTENLKNDVYKMSCAKKSGIKMIRICQEDLWNNQEVYEDILTKLLSEPLTEDFTYISSDPYLYDNHKKAISAFEE